MKLKLIVIICLSLVSGLSLAAYDLQKEYNELETTTNEKIEVIDQKLEKLKSKTKNVAGKAQDELQEQYEEALEMREELKDQLAQAKEVSQERWSDTKREIKQFTAKVERKVDQVIN